VGFFRTRIASQNKKRKAVVVILLRVEDPLGAGSAELNSQVLTRVNPLSPNHRFVIALRSLRGVFETGLARRPSEKRSTKQAHGPGRDVFSSPVQRENPKNCADFSQFSGKCNEVSLHSRLRGGEGGIRTLDTGVSPYTKLVNASLLYAIHSGGSGGIVRIA
jgi:hypothetical protein